MSEWLVRPAKLADAMYVFDHLWERGARELEAYGIGRDEWRSRWEFMTLIPDCAYAFVHGDRVVAVLGAMRDGDFATMWFQATGEFDSLGLGLTRRMRKATEELSRRAGVKRAALTSLCISEDAPRWYEFLGFKEDADYVGPSVGAHSERRFVWNWS